MRSADLLIGYLMLQGMRLMCWVGLHPMQYITVYWPMTHVRVMKEVPCCICCHMIPDEHMHEIGTNALITRTHPYSVPYPM